MTNDSRDPTEINQGRQNEKEFHTTLNAPQVFQIWTPADCATCYGVAKTYTYLNDKTGK